LLRAVCRAYGTLAQGATWRCSCGSDRPEGTVRGDPLRVRQIVSNYLSNAVKFTARGSVRLVARRRRPVRIEVHDSGDGITPRCRCGCSKPFTQADESTTRRFGGTGLGLSICRELAHLMGGEVGVTASPAAAAASGPNCRCRRPPGCRRHAAARHGTLLERLRGTRVLMVEDNTVNMLIAVAMLERWGVEVGQANDGREASTRSSRPQPPAGPSTPC
jgi:signal transduction histidine kinase